MAASQVIDASGRQFGRLTVIERAAGKPGQRNAVWRCLCDCGTEVVVRGSSLREGHTQSCGCLKVDVTVERSTTHGQTKNKIRTNEYSSWAAMIQRCTNPRNTRWKDYGGRGITVCVRWLVFEDFFADMGPQPSPTHDSIERVENDVGYQPGNCQWATRVEQQSNRRNTVWITIDGATKTLATWARESGEYPQLVKARAVRDGRLIRRGSPCQK